MYQYDITIYIDQNGNLEICKTNFSIKELSEQTYNEILPLAQKKQIEFVLNYKPSEDLIINADRGEIRRVITNLCGNAINYTDINGKIDVWINRFNFFSV